MLQTMVSLLDAERSIHVQVHDGLVDLALAALSAEPVTIDELRVAMGRFMDPDVVDFFFTDARNGLATRRTEGGHVIVDFTARLVVNGGAAPQMPRLGCVLRCDQHTTLDVWLPYRIPDAWLTTLDTRHWQELAARRRPSVAAEEDLDARAVLYPQLARILLDRYLDTRGANPAEIQDWWLLTPRDDLRGRSPRDLLLARRRFIDGDIEDQGEIWSLLGRCPPGLPTRAHAYRFGGFGTHEIILYHELVAVLLCEIDRRLAGRADIDPAGEVAHIEQFQQEWMHQPQEDLYDQSPAALIARERARLPAVIPKGHEHLDDDCPLCRMMADSNQPMIWQLDNYMLQERFATSFCASRSEWELERYDVPEAESSPALADAHARPNTFADDQRVWQNSFTNMSSLTEMPAWESVNVMLFAIGGHLAELVHDLRSRVDDGELIEQLHIRFDELRVAVKQERESFIVRGAVSDFVSALHSIVEVREDLAPKCADLELKTEFLEQRYGRHAEE